MTKQEASYPKGNEAGNNQCFCSMLQNQGAIGASQLKISDIITAGNALKCILSQSNGRGQKMFCSFRSQGASFSVLPLSLEKLSAALATVHSVTDKIAEWIFFAFHGAF